MNILVINPGGTSTKIAVFKDEELIFKKSIVHSQEEIGRFQKVFDQFEYRYRLITEALVESSIDTSFDAVVGRGGLMKPIQGGVYEINDKMISDMQNEISGEHASNLGAPLAKKFGECYNIKSFVVDPVSVDEYLPVSRLTGLSEITKYSWLHPLNQKAVCRKIAEKMGGKYEDFNFIVAHLGSGISIGAHKRGLLIDGSGGRSDGPFSPERSGGILTYQLVELCYSGKYTRDEMIDKISNRGGFYDYLGTKDMQLVEKYIKEGNKKAELVMDAFILQVSKEICSYFATLEGEVDKIILTGGIAYSDFVVKRIIERIEKLASIEVVAGELEMEAMAAGAIRVLSGKEKTKIYL